MQIDCGNVCLCVRASVGQLATSHSLFLPSPHPSSFETLHVIPDNVVNNWRIEAANSGGWLCLAGDNNWQRKWRWLVPLALVPLSLSPSLCVYLSCSNWMPKRKMKLKGCARVVVGAKARAKQSRKHLTEWNTSKQMKVSKHKTSHTANSQRQRKMSREKERQREREREKGRGD